MNSVLNKINIQFISYSDSKILAKKHILTMLSNVSNNSKPNIELLHFQLGRYSTLTELSQDHKFHKKLISHKIHIYVNIKYDYDPLKIEHDVTF